MSTTNSPTILLNLTHTTGFLVLHSSFSIRHPSFPLGTGSKRVQYGLWYGFDLQNHPVLCGSVRVYGLGPMHSVPPPRLSFSFSPHSDRSAVIRASKSSPSFGLLLCLRKCSPRPSCPDSRQVPIAPGACSGGSGHVPIALGEIMEARELSGPNRA